jgi:hypothetical protein
MLSGKKSMRINAVEILRLDEREQVNLSFVVLLRALRNR